MGASIYPFLRFLRKISVKIDSRKDGPRLQANLRYLEECKRDGRSPYDGLDDHLESFEKKARGKE